MIKDVALRTEPIATGEVRELVVDGTAPIQVSIKCFVKEPPPPKYEGCPECGAFTLESGKPLLFQASDTRFAKGGGALVIAIRDGDGDTAQFRLEVKNWGNPTSYQEAGALKTKPSGDLKRQPQPAVVSAEIVDEKVKARTYQVSAGA